jgi:outer membrane protein assembly factor BamB
VWTQHNDNFRSGANTNETHIDVAKLTQLGMVKMRHIALDGPASTGLTGRIDTQPLYLPQITMWDGLVHDVVFVASEYNDVFAFDANTGAKIWHQSPDPVTYTCSQDKWRVGVHSTSVIDLNATPPTMYIVFGDNSTGGYKLGALDVTTGKPRALIPIAASVPHGNSQVVFNGANQASRPGLLLSGSNLYMAFGANSGEEGRVFYQGWVLQYNVTDTSNIRLTGAFTTAPDATAPTPPAEQGLV